MLWCLFHNYLKDSFSIKNLKRISVVCRVNSKKTTFFHRLDPGAELTGSNWSQVLRIHVTVAASPVLRFYKPRKQKLAPGSVRGTRQRWQRQNMLSVKPQQQFHEDGRSTKSHLSRSCGIILVFFVSVCVWGQNFSTRDNSLWFQVITIRGCGAGNVILYQSLRGNSLFSLWFSTGGLRIEDQPQSNIPAGMFLRWKQQTQVKHQTCVNAC